MNQLSIIKKHGARLGLSITGMQLAFSILFFKSGKDTYDIAERYKVPEWLVANLVCKGVRVAK